jgi:UDP-4-amino-4,6-dideoxy-N-acetyl-beta-L-altrosamine N-acetyltransferase
MFMTSQDNVNAVIRPMTNADLQRVFTWRNHDQIRQYMLTPNKITFSHHVRWFERVSQDPTRHLLIFEESGKPRGFVQFERTACVEVSNWGFYTDPKAPKGTGKRLGNLALNYAFSILGMHKVCGQTLAFNEGSIGLHKYLGFQQEALLHKQHRVENKFYDVLSFGLLNSEWNRSDES